jgi:hypothetical protein
MDGFSKAAGKHKSKHSAPKNEDKLRKVMHEFKRGAHKPSSGQKVMDKKHALATSFGERRRVRL